MLPQNIGVSRSAANTAIAVWGGQTYPIESDYTVGVTLVTIARNNPNRFELIVTNWGQAVIAIGTHRTLTATTGTAVAPNGGVAVISVLEDGEMAIGEIYAISLAASNPVHTTENVLV